VCSCRARLLAGPQLRAALREIRVLADASTPVTTPTPSPRRRRRTRPPTARRPYAGLIAAKRRASRAGRLGGGAAPSGLSTTAAVDVRAGDDGELQLRGQVAVAVADDVGSGIGEAPDAERGALTATSSTTTSRWDVAPRGFHGDRHARCALESCTSFFAPPGRGERRRRPRRHALADDAVVGSCASTTLPSPARPARARAPASARAPGCRRRKSSSAFAYSLAGARVPRPQAPSAERGRSVSDWAMAVLCCTGLCCFMRKHAMYGASVIVWWLRYAFSASAYHPLPSFDAPLLVLFVPPRSLPLMLIVRSS